MAIARAARTIALTVMVCALTLPTAAPAATLDLHHESTAVGDLDGGDGIISSGDSLAVTETIRSGEPGAALTGIVGTLSTSTPNVTVPQPSAAFPTLSFADTAASLTPFGVQLDASLPCGQNVNLALAVSADQGTATIPFSIGTGQAAAPDTYTSADVPHGIPDANTLTSTLSIANAARVKQIAVHIGRINHDYDGDLRISLIAPDGTRVLLVDQRGSNSHNFINTTITSDDEAAPLAGASGPFTGTYKADGDLSKLVGVPEQGNWKLELQDLSSGNIGTLESWGLEISDATCAAQPVANFTATPDPALPGETVQFDATSSHDPVGVINQYEWDFDGDGVFEAGGATPFASHSYPERGAYPVSLRVSDDTGHHNIYTRSVHISRAPTAALTATPLAPLSNTNVTLDASDSSDPDGTMLSYAWDLDGDGTYESETGTVPQASKVFTTPGVHTVGVRVTDGDGATDSETLDIAVTNRVPTASIADPGLGVVGQQLTLGAGGSSDSDGTIEQYEWDLDNDGSYEADSGSISTRGVIFDSAGMKTVGLRVTDNDGGTATTTVTFKVTAAPEADLTATPNPARPAQVVTLDATGSSDPDGTALSYKWDLDNDGTFEIDGGANGSRTKSWATPGNYTVKVKVTDADGVSAVASQVVVVANELPIASVVVSGGEAVAGTPVMLDASGSSDPDGTVVRYQWDLDANGSFETDQGTTPTVTRTYPNAATIAVKLKVTDNDGGTAVKTFSLVVKAPATGGPAGPAGPGTPGGNGGTGGTGGSGETGETGGGGSSPSGDFSAGLGGAPIQGIKLARRKGVTMTCTSDRAMRCSVTATIDGGTAKKLRLARKRKAATVGSAVVDVAAGANGRFVLKLTKKARKALKRAKRVRLLVKGTAVDGDGHTYPIARTVLLR